MNPGKSDLVNPWLASQPWYEGVPAEELASVGAFRFDDPAGRVGMETLLLGSGGELWQLPVTYRDAPLEGADEWLIGTSEHSVLGTRYVYHAIGDPVYLAVASRAIAEGGSEADLVRDLGDGTTEDVVKTMTARGTGTSRGSGDGELLVEHRPGPASEADRAEGSGVLLGALPGGDPLLLARLM